MDYKILVLYEEDYTNLAKSDVFMKRRLRNTRVSNFVVSCTESNGYMTCLLYDEIKFIRKKNLQADNQDK